MRERRHQELWTPVPAIKDSPSCRELLNLFSNKKPGTEDMEQKIVAADMHRDSKVDAETAGIESIDRPLVFFE